jgi:hypothetical protein
MMAKWQFCDAVLRGSEVGRLVARQLQGAPGQVDELVVIHRKSPAVECGPMAGSPCIVDLNFESTLLRSLSRQVLRPTLGWE